MSDERRTHPRVPLSIDGRWQGAEGAGLCRTANLSLGGCFARTPVPPAVDQPMLVTLFFGGRGALLVKGQVVRVEPGVGFGMQFGELMPETRHRLHDEIAQIRRRSGLYSSSNH
jgi:hypothetical protein